MKSICPFGFDRVGDDDGAPLYHDRELGDIASDCLADTQTRWYAASELMRRIIMEHTDETEQTA